jgi:uncharacterized FlgJ-related protein
MKEILKSFYPILLITMAFAIFVAGAYTSKNLLTNNPVVKTEIIYDATDPYTETKAKEYLTQLKVRYVNVALAQLKLESGSATSKVFRENNNLFGMKPAEKRPTTALGSKNNHAYYSHWRQSIIDYALWQAYVMNADNISDENSWVNYINRHYSEIPGEYKRRLLAIKNKIDAQNTL